MNKCFLIQNHYEVTVVYIHVPGHPRWHLLGRRFVETYQANPPGMPHKMVIVSQGEMYPDMAQLFDGLGDWELFKHDNSAWDIGAFQRYSKQCTTPLLVCLSGTTYFRRPGWLKRMSDVFWKYNGVGLFGACGNGGDLGKSCHPHIRTSSMWFSPHLLNSFPYEIARNEERYPFEHGPYNFTLWVQGQGLPTVVVDFSTHHEFGSWGANPRGYHQSDQLDLLVGDRNTEPPDYPFP